MAQIDFPAVDASDAATDDRQADEHQQRNLHTLSTTPLNAIEPPSSVVAAAPASDASAITAPSAIAGTTFRQILFGSIVASTNATAAESSTATVTTRAFANSATAPRSPSRTPPNASEKDPTDSTSTSATDPALAEFLRGLMQCAMPPTPAPVRPGSAEGNTDVPPADPSGVDQKPHTACPPAEDSAATSEPAAPDSQHAFPKTPIRPPTQPSPDVRQAASAISTAIANHFPSLIRSAETLLAFAERPTPAPPDASRDTQHLPRPVESDATIAPANERDVHAESHHASTLTTPTAGAQSETQVVAIENPFSLHQVAVDPAQFPASQPLNFTATLPSPENYASTGNESANWGAQIPCIFYENSAPLSGTLLNETGGQEIHFTLNPPELGSLQIAVTQKDGQLAARLDAQLVSTRKLLQTNLPQLKEALSRQGFTVNRLEIGQFDTPPDPRASVGQQSSQQNSSQQQPGHPGFITLPSDLEVPAQRQPALAPQGRPQQGRLDIRI